MKKYAEFEEYDLLAKVELIKTEFSGRSQPVLDDYRGQFFWHINHESCTDWLATYIFEFGELHPGASSKCKIVLAGTIKELGKGTFKVGAQFAIREGSRIMAIGKILEVRGDALQRH
jgi:translation elongation factor EF-Tu-like GTPase